MHTRRWAALACQPYPKLGRALARGSWIAIHGTACGIRRTAVTAAGVPVPRYQCIRRARHALRHIRHCCALPSPRSRRSAGAWGRGATAATAAARSTTCSLLACYGPIARWAEDRTPGGALHRPRARSAGSAEHAAVLPAACRVPHRRARRRRHSAQWAGRGRGFLHNCTQEPPSGARAPASIATRSGPFYSCRPSLLSITDH